MRNADDGDFAPGLTCSLCGKRQHDVSDLASGPADFVREFVCDECVCSELTKPESPTPTGSPMFKVLLLNDNHTPMDFVVCALVEVFELEHEHAVRIILQTYHEGFGTCGTFPRDEAEARAARVMDLARQHRHPLRCCWVEQTGSS